MSIMINNWQYSYMLFIFMFVCISALFRSRIYVYTHTYMQIVHTIIFGGRETFLILLMDTNGLI